MIKAYPIFIVMILIPDLVYAHIGDKSGGFISGISHPVLGLDHFLAMISVGILSAQIGGRAIWTVPATFVSVMVVGGIMGMKGVPIISVELGIAFSVFTLGIAIAAAHNIPIFIAMFIVGVFAIFHGHAHGTEMPIVSQPVLYALGFISGTSLIHILGVLIGVVSKKIPQGAMMLRFIGAGIAGIGFHLLLM